MKAIMTAILIMLGAVSAHADPATDAKNSIGNAYVYYIYLQRCREARAGYLIVHISEPEIDRARYYVKRIEDKYKSQLDPSITLAWMWDQSNKISVDKNPVISWQACQLAFERMMYWQKLEFPGDNVIRKDF